MWFNVVHNVRMSTKKSPPSIRLTIPVDCETHAVFQRLAQAGNMSTGRAMGEWLRDTVEAADIMASTMERARAAPKLVTSEIHAMILGLADQTKELQEKYSKFKGPVPGGDSGDGMTGSEAGQPGGAGTIPPPCNTGGKLPQNKTKQNKGTS